MSSKNTVRITECMSIESRVCEMSDISEVDVPVDPRIDIDVITADDDDPKFVNVEVLRAGISKTNRRRYNNNVVREVNDMIPGVQGFYGHPDPSKEGFEFREPQCIFVGSMVEHMPDGIDRTIAKAYLFKTSALREWIPKSIAAGNPMTVSINGTGDVMRGNDVIDVVHMSDLQSVDWANPGTEGMCTSQAISVVKELQNKKGGLEMPDNNAKQIISEVTVSELKAYNPDGYDGVIKNVTVEELRRVNPEVVSKIEDGCKVTELALKVGGEDKSVKISELQGIITGLEEKNAQLESDINDAKITEMKSRLIGEMIPEEFREKVGCRITGTTEDEIKASIENEVAYIREMGCNWDNQPVGRLKDNKNSDEMKSAIAGLFGHKSEE